jgi:hypothetical protein
MVNSSNSFGIQLQDAPFFAFDPVCATLDGMFQNLFLVTLLAQAGSWNLHLISHQIGEERYNIEKSENGMVVTSSFEYSDRGNKRPVAMTTAEHSRRDGRVSRRR